MKTREEIQDWLEEKIAAATRRQPSEVGIDVPFTDFGIDSIVVVTLAVDLEDWMGVRLDATIFWEHPTIRDLTEWLLQAEVSESL